MAKVSVIVPAHNPGAYLREALQSVHDQIYADWQLIIIDDNSSEDLSWISLEFPKAQLIRQSHGGVSVARNNGILNSTGEYIAFMDQDDVWRPGKLARQVAAMESAADIAICYCGLELIDGNGNLMTLSKTDADEHKETGTQENGVGDASFVVELDGADLSRTDTRMSNVHRSIVYFSSRFVVPSTVMMRRTYLSTSGLLDPFIPFSGDFDLLIKLGAKHKVVRIFTNDVLYRKHANNFSDQYDVGRAEVEALIARYTAYAHAQGDKSLARNTRRLFGRPARMYAAQAYDCARRGVRQRDFRQVAHHLWRAFWFSPRFVIGSMFRWRFVRKPENAPIKE